MGWLRKRCSKLTRILPLCFNLLKLFCLETLLISAFLGRLRRDFDDKTASYYSYIDTDIYIDIVVEWEIEDETVILFCINY